MISFVISVEFFLLDDSPASEFHVPTFLNTLSSASVTRSFEDGTGSSETSAHKIQTSRNHPKEIIHHLSFMYVCYGHGTNRLILEGYSWNFIFVNLKKIC
jgi:hypothetical protein